MITSVTYKPNHLSPAYNPIVWSCLSNFIDEPNMKYVFDIYLDDATWPNYTIRIKQSPNPAGYGMIDISQIMQGYLDYSQSTSPINNGETTIDYNRGEVFETNDYLSRKVSIKVGEETYTGGEFLIYNGSDDSVEDPLFPLYSGNSTDTSLWVKTWPASLPEQEQMWHMQKTTDSGVFGGNPWLRDSFGVAKVFDFGITLSYPLSFDSLSRDVYTFDKLVLSFLNYSAYHSATYNRIFGFRFIIKNSAGSVIHTESVPMTTTYGFSQRATSITVESSQLAPYDIVHVLASPKNLMTAIGETNNHPLSAGMKIEITGHAQASPGSPTFGAALTQTVVLTIKEYCPDPLYKRVRLSWLNTLGGRDYMNFTAFLEKSTVVKSDEFFREQLNWSGAVPVVTNGDATPINRLGMLGGMKPYNKQSYVSYQVESDWLNQDQLNLLEGLVNSPQVLAYIHDEDNPLSDDYPYVVKVRDLTYVTKNVRQYKMSQGKFTIELVTPQKIQVTY